MSEAEPTPPGADLPDPPATSAYAGPRPTPYGSVPYGTAAEPAPSRAAPLVQRADLWAALLGTIAVAPLGALAALVWVWLAPRVVTVKTAGGVSLPNAETKAFVGADVTYLAIAVVAGVLCGVVAAIIGRHRGSAVAVAMAAGGFAAAWLMAWLGRWLSGGPESRWAAHLANGTHHYFIELQARPFLMAWPVAALVVTFLVALVTDTESPAERG